MDKLSPSAQAVLDATANAYFDWDDGGPAADMAAAALRAAADKVVPEENVDDAEYHCLQAKWAAEGEQDARMRFLAIADELEALKKKLLLTASTFATKTSATPSSPSPPSLKLSSPIILSPHGRTNP